MSKREREICLASGSEWRCGNPAAIGRLCAAHYMQKRRAPNDPFSEVGSRRLPEVLLRRIGFEVPEADARTIDAEASTRGVPASALYREAVAVFARVLRDPTNTDHRKR